MFSNINVHKFITGEVVDRIDLTNSPFNTNPRLDLIKRVISWQLENRMSGTKKVKNISEVSGTGKKPHAQKGTGRARMATKRPVQARGGCAPFALSTAHNPKIQKKVRIQALFGAIADKIINNQMIIVDELSFNLKSTRLVLPIINKYFDTSCIMLSGKSSIDSNLSCSVRNLYNVYYNTYQSLNVYDVVKHKFLIVDQSFLTQMVNKVS